MHVQSSVTPIVLVAAFACAAPACRSRATARLEDAGARRPRSKLGAVDDDASARDEARAAAADAGMEDVTAAVKRYADERFLPPGAARVVHATAAFSATPLDAGTWIEETLPAGRRVEPLAARDVRSESGVRTFELVRWRPLARMGDSMMGWIAAEDLAPTDGEAGSDEASSAASATGVCPAGSGPYGAIPCVKRCWSPSECRRPNRCVATEPPTPPPLGDTMGVCMTPDGKLE